MQIYTNNSQSPSIDVSTDTISVDRLQSSKFYEAAISADETIVSNYLYLGISYLLEGREEDARSAWFLPLSLVSEAEIDNYNNLLLTLLEREANYKFEISDLENAWLLRQNIWMLDPERLDNILHLIVLADVLDRLTPEILLEWQVDELLKIVVVESLNDELLEKTVAALLKKDVLFNDRTLNIVEGCIKMMSDAYHHLIVPKLVNIAFQIFNQKKVWFFPIRIVEICRDFAPEDLNLLQVLSGFYSAVDRHPEAIATVELFAKLTNNCCDRLFSSYLIQRAYLTAGNWNGYLERLELHRQSIEDVLRADISNSLQFQRQRLAVSSFFTPYIEDNPKVNRPLQNQLAKICQDNLNPLVLSSEFEELSLEKKSGVLRIGYLASTLKEHSVGWLSRWLIHYHDRESFQVFTYCINQSRDDLFNHKWFRDKVNVSYYFNGTPEEVAIQIKEDEIDILIDLDSITFDLSCVVMAYKPAPIQATWLGLDASGIPAIDYFIVDPYVLPDDAQAYYQEKLWRLPQTYLAVDGFEVGIATLKRQDLDIPADAVVYFSNQAGFKRHPDNIRCQIRVIAAVPNSYLLIKGKSDPDMIRDLFGKICEEEGVSIDRLRFLPGVPDEYTHRANLAIADVVLDTFPYNGATTTLETLWMGIPMVTQVGQQFAARNSYTFMLNAGIEEGIASSAQEYVEWGIKLGLDRELRMQIREKLRLGRQTAPVWNAKQFTRDMEQAYREMWAIYQADRDRQNEIERAALN